MKSYTAREIEVLYEPLMKIGCVGNKPEDGYFRPSWFSEEDEAFNYIRSEAEKFGLQARYDAVGNLFLEQTGFDEYVEAGSHLDTVVNGGNYDGVAGIIAGLAAIRAIIESGCSQRRGLRLRIWRGEESATFAATCKGSRAAFGKLPAASLSRTFRDITLEQAIQGRGYSAEPIRKGTKTIEQSEIDGIAAHLELHIEQANSLEKRGVDIGVVTSIRGPIRWLCTLRGRFDHSGGTPMGTDFRRDANLALAYLIVELDALCTRAIASGSDLVQTFGMINSDPALCAPYPDIRSNAIAKVSGLVCFSLDIRSSNSAFRQEYVEQAFQKATEVAERFNVEFSFEKISETEPNESLDASVQALELASARELGYSVESIPSGAVHDCLYVAEQVRRDGSHVPIGMLFIPCRDGVSHAPEEFTTFEAVAKGTNVLARTMLKLVNS